MIYTYDGLYTIVLYVLLGIASIWLACGIFVTAVVVVMLIKIASSSDVRPPHDPDEQRT